MSQYQPPLGDIAFLLKDVFPLDSHAERCGLEIDVDTALAVAEEAGKFATGRLDSINRTGDKTGARWSDSSVATADGFREAYSAFCEGGWNGLKFPEAYGGQGLSQVIAAVVDEMWHSANMSFALCPMLTNGAIEALLTAGSDELKQRYLPKMISGEWTGTMNLTEPQAGSDLAAIQSKALRQSDGSYRIVGQKIFITYGDHDLADNIIHMVLARTPDAPKGVKGISLFAIPKFLVNADGSLGERNDLRCSSLEHKFGIHASPTAVMLFGEQGGAVGYLVGEENRGLEYMFIMMNDARFAVGIQGLAISERAYQHAVWYAAERVQGRILDEDGAHGKTILRHPDIRRTLLSMKSRIDAMRALAIFVATEKDTAHLGATEVVRQAARAQMEFLIPIVKGWFTETAQTVTYDALQVFGGMGFVEETGAAQYYRDARITTIYEGTTAIQANDLVGRKTLRDGGEVASQLIHAIIVDGIRLQSVTRLSAKRFSEQLIAACATLREAINWLLGTSKKHQRAVYAGAVPYLELWGIAAGAWMHALRLQAASRANLSADAASAIETSAMFYCEHILAHVPALASAIRQGADWALAFPDSQWNA